MAKPTSSQQMKTYTNTVPVPRYITREEYAEYLQTSRWRKLRARCKARAGEWCQAPGCENLGTEAHHVSYRHRGKDFDAELADLRWLCHGCHARAHGLWAK